MVAVLLGAAFFGSGGGGGAAAAAAFLLRVTGACFTAAGGASAVGVSFSLPARLPRLGAGFGALGSATSTERFARGILFYSTV